MQAATKPAKPEISTGRYQQLLPEDLTPLRPLRWAFLFEVSDMSENRQGTDSPKRKAPKTAFAKGVSGNPGGRPPKTEEQRTLEALCREKSLRAFEILSNIMEGGENERNKITAALAIIERGHGKPVQPIEQNLTATVKSAKELTDDELAAIAAGSSAGTVSASEG